LCFWGIVVRLVTGCSWVTAERLLRHEVSDTTLRARRDEWVDAGVFDRLVTEALAAYDRIIGLEPAVVSLDGSQQKAPCGGEGTGVNPVDKRKLGWKWSLVADRNGIPLAWVTDGANRHDMVLLEPTLDALAERGLLTEVETIHLDRGYSNNRARTICAEHGINEVVCAKKRNPGQGRLKIIPLGQRWTIERTNAWLADYGQLYRNTDRRPSHRLAQLALAVTVLLTARLVDRRNRWTT
jgi:transposase